MTSRRPRNPVRLAGLGLAALGVLAFSLACRLADDPAFAGPAGRSLGARLLGSARSTLGGRFMERADTYLHRGVEERPRVAFTGFYSRWRDALVPAVHAHAEGTGAAEILPWLRLSTRADPHQVEAYLGAAFWLQVAGGTADQAHAILREAWQHNPRDYRIQIEWAWLSLQTGDVGEAARHLDIGLACWPGPLDPAGKDARFDAAQMLSLRGYVYVAANQREPAMACFRQALVLSPEHDTWRAALDALERGEDRAEQTAALLKQTFMQARTVPMACGREDHDHDHAEYDAHEAPEGHHEDHE